MRSRITTVALLASVSLVALRSKFACVQQQKRSTLGESSVLAFWEAALTDSDDAAVALLA